LEFVKPSIAAILNKKSITPGITNPGDRRRRKYRHKCFRNFSSDSLVNLRQDRWHFLIFTPPFRKFLEWKKDRSRVGLIAAEKIKPCKFYSVQDAGCFPRNLGNLVDDGLGPIER